MGPLKKALAGLWLRGDHAGRLAGWEECKRKESAGVQDCRVRGGGRGEGRGRRGELGKKRAEGGETV